MKNLQQAIDFCLEAHSRYSKEERHSARKWDRQTPYAVHPLWCAMTFLQETSLPELIDREIAASALLFHDILEDTSAELPEWLPQNTGELVEQMTFNSSVVEMKQVWSRPPLVRLLKLYDKVSNLLDGCWMSDEKWNQYVAYVLRLTADIEQSFGQLNIVRLARAIAIPREGSVQEKEGDGKSSVV